MKQLLWNLWTTLQRFRTSSFLNIIGLAVAFASLYIIAVQINYDVFYNRNIKDAERIYRLEAPSWFHDGKYTIWFNRVIPENCCKNTSTVESFGCGSVWKESTCTVINDNRQSHYEVKKGEVSLGFLDVFEYQTIAGKIKDIERPKTIAVSETTAKRLGVGVGDNIYLSQTAEKESMRQIVAIYKDYPSNTDISKIEMFENVGEASLTNYGQWGYLYYIKIARGNTPEKVAAHLTAGWRDLLKNYGWDEKSINETVKKSIRLVPIGETYFRDDVDGAVGAISIGSKATTYTLIAVAFLIVFIAFINFINFFFALVPLRIKSVNTRKVFGCSQLKLRSMLMFESVGLVAIALFVAAFIVMYSQNTRLAQLISAPLSFPENGAISLLVAALAFVLAIFVGIYTALYITSFPMAMSIKSSFGASRSGRRLRYILVGFQFVISIALIICAIFIRMQFGYMMRYDMGFNKECVLTSSVKGKIPNNIETRNAFDSKLKSNPQIEDVAWGDGSFVAETRDGWGRYYKEKSIQFQGYSVSWNFLHFMGIEIVEGRDFVESDEMKENGTYIFNQRAKLDFDIDIQDQMIDQNVVLADIAGVCKNFNFMPLQYSVEPFAFYVYGKKVFRAPVQLYLRTTADADIKSIIDFVKKTVVEFDPNKYKEDVNVEFFDQELQRNYEKEQNLSLLITLFSVLAIIISLMGVFGLVMFETQHRMKEIAIRRVHGASVSQMLGIFNSKFVKIVAICFVIAAPISYYIIDYWLGSYTYKMPIYWWVFAIALFVVLAITVTTVTIRSYSAATSDPAKTVKTE